MMKLSLPVFVLMMFGLTLPPLSSHAQTKEEQLRQMKQQLKRENEEIKFLHESHDQAKKKQLDDLQKEKKLKEEDLERAQSEMNQTKEQAKK